ncbi:helix-turn-helix domain-containing protein [Undibacterium sp. Tian12W]|uniref:helix-turn-helix domain-containing protein n=1 Tax=Undibacterium sp. Tian12W TaxID=3413054 RepID=UPI003BF404E5
MKMSETWSGDLWLAKDYAIFHGSLGVSTIHAHHAHQLILAQNEPAHVEIGSDRVRASQIWIESMRSHAILTPLVSHYSVYAEPHAIDGQLLLKSISTNEITMSALNVTMDKLGRKPPLDTRVEHALRQVDLQLEGKISADKIAKSVHISLSQLERLFSAQLGLSVRRLVLWRRLRVALATTLQGWTLTEAAHAAGFADSAHLSRTMRSIFGIRADRSLAHMRLRLLN